MPSVNQYDSRRPVYVEPFTGSGIFYGFRTNCRNAVSTALGHTAVNMGQLPASIVFGCNAPKPGRASRLDGDQYDSSFFDFKKYAELKNAGWRTTKPFARMGRTTSRTATVYVQTNSRGTASGTIKYAWTMPTGLYTKIEGDLEQLGINLADSGEIGLMWGVDDPKPPRVQKVVIGQGGVDILETFCAPNKLDSLPEGWAKAGSSAKTYISLG